MAPVSELGQYRRLQFPLSLAHRRPSGSDRTAPARPHMRGRLPSPRAINIVVRAFSLSRRVRALSQSRGKCVQWREGVFRSHDRAARRYLHARWTGPGGRPNPAAICRRDVASDRDPAVRRPSMQLPRTAVAERARRIGLSRRRGPFQHVVAIVQGPLRLALSVNEV